LGGITGITIFTAVYNNRYTAELPKNVANALSGTSDSQNITSEVLKALSSGAPPVVALKAIPTLSKNDIRLVMSAIVDANAASWKWVWVVIAYVQHQKGPFACTYQLMQVHHNHQCHKLLLLEIRKAQHDVSC